MSKLIRDARHLLHKATPQHIIGRRVTSRMVRKFADDLGLVYFGFVDQQDDDHRLLRGITVSTTHDDHYYSVGTYKGYDMAVTVRRDTLRYPDKRLKDHHWTILTFDLHTERDLPHIYMGHHTVRDELLARYTELSAMTLGAYSQAQYPRNFLEEYTVYGRLTHAQEIDALITPDVAQVITQRFDGISVELQAGTLYLYRAEKHPERALLERMTNAGIWLAEAIDQRADVR
jgi:hypothetical protein